MKMWILKWLIATLVSPQIPGLIEELARRDPNQTALMLLRTQQGKIGTGPIEYRPVPLNQIAALLQRAVVLSEDASFWFHYGLDVVATRDAFLVNLAHGRIVRGGSTITQQLCKNLFLRPERTVQRKIQEVLLALYMEQVLTKRRILELYLNVIEWGPGVFGIEAAAQHHFKKRAIELQPEEVALLTAVIPSPLRMDPGHPSDYVYLRRNQILALLEQAGELEPGTVPW